MVLNVQTKGQPLIRPGYGYKDVAPPPLTVEQLKEIFKRYDTNKDGQLSVGELVAAFEYLGSRFSYLRALWARSKADNDKDGKINLDDDELSILVEHAHSCGYKVKDRDSPKKKEDREISNRY